MIRTIGIYGGRGDLLSALRAACPGVELATDDEARDAARIALIDIDAPATVENPPRKSIVRIVLTDGMPLPPGRRNGELRVERKAFLSEPEEFLAFASEMA